MLAQDPHSHVAVETCATVGQFFVFGEVTSEGYSDIQNIVRSVVRNIATPAPAWDLTPIPAV